MRPHEKMWTLLVVGTTVLLSARAEFLMGGHLDNKHAVQITDDAGAASSHLVLAKSVEDTDGDLVAEESGNVASTTYPDQEPRYKIPYAFAFNGGKPFSLEKDPITGKIDLEKAPPLKAVELSETYQDEDVEGQDENDETARIDNKDNSYGKVSYSESKRVVSTNSKSERIGPNEINPYSPSFHDFLNLPVKYSSEKYETYPLISSSYANTKVQSGSNSYNINNHRPYHDLDVVTKTSVSASTRKVYYPKTTSTTPKTTTSTTTSTTTTTTTTRRPETTSTTTTTTTTTTPKPTTTTTTKATTTTSTQSPAMQSKVTTWKPAKSTGPYEDYEDMLPIEKLTSTKFGYPMGDKGQNGHNNGPQSPTQVTTSYDYSDGYEDYSESSLEDQHHQQQQQQQQQNTHSVDIVQSIEIEGPSSVGTTLTEDASSSSSSATVSSTHTPVTSPKPFQSTPIVHLTTSKPVMVPISQPQQPVTSMPLDSGASGSHVHVPPVHENVIESHRPTDFFGNNNNNNNNNKVVGHGSVHFPSGSGMFGRPGSVISVLPESTSNVIVPHDQDTVSFVLGNRQNVEGSYYTHGSTAEEQRPYVPNQNENNFRPIFGSGSANVQQPAMMDQKVSVAMPSVSVVDSSVVSAGYNTQQWYSQPMKTVSESDSQTAKPQSSIVFPSTSTDNENNSDKNDNSNNNNSKEQEVQVSGFVSFPENNQDKQQSDNNQSPVEEHVIVINQADGSIKEITPNGPVVENTVIFNNQNGNNNNNENPIGNNPNLPQLSESLTPPAEARPPRPGPPPNGVNQRPPYYFHYQHGPGGPPNGKPSPDFPPRPQRLPLPPRPKPAEMPPVGFKRRPNPTHDPNLPNILPQFRPNAKTSHGHRGNDKIGTLQAGGPPQPYIPSRPPRPLSTQPQPPHLHPSRRPVSVPHQHPPHLLRLNPPPLPPPGSAQPPNHPPHPHPHPHPQQQQQLPHQHQQYQLLNQAPPLRKKDDIDSLKRYGRPPTPQVVVRQSVAQKLRMEDEMAGDRFPAEPPQVPPRPIIFPANRIDSQMPKVATLQMIQQRGGFDEDVLKSNLPPLFKVNNNNNNNNGDEDKEEDNSTLSNEAERRKDAAVLDNQDAAGTSENGPVYVVYPVNSAVNIGSQEDTVERDESVVIGTRGPHMPLPPDTLPHDDDDVETEGGNKGDKLAGVFFGKRPHHNAVNSDFGSQGYPDSPVLEEEHKKQQHHHHQHQQLQQEEESSSGSDSSFNVISYLQDLLPFGKKPQTATISVTLPRLPLGQTSSPIAYVYTPTTPSASNHRHHDFVDEDEEDQRIARPDRRPDEKPVLLPSQQPSSSSSSAPSPQNFQAPFLASVSAEMPVKNGWSVVVSPPPQQVNGTERTKDENKKESTSTSGKVADDRMSASQENESQTERSDAEKNNEEGNFDPDKFKPQLFGGFKPIYEFPVEEEENPALTGRAAAASVSAAAAPTRTGRKLMRTLMVRH